MERTKKEKKDFINEIIDSLNLIFVIHSMIILNTIILQTINERLSIILKDKFIKIIKSLTKYSLIV